MLPFYSHMHIYNHCISIFLLSFLHIIYSYYFARVDLGVKAILKI